MTELKLSGDIIQYMGLFIDITKAKVKDCIEREDKIIFVVERGELGKAIGKNGINIKTLKEVLKKDIDIIEFSDNIVQFIRNIFHNYNVENVELGKQGIKDHINVKIEQKDKGRAIGKEGRNLKIARDIIFRHFGIESMVIS